MTSAAKTIATLETAPQPGAAMVETRPDRLQDRYALALIELAETHKVVDAITGDVSSLQDALATSPVLRKLLANPVQSRATQAKALTAIAAKLGLHTLTTNFLRLIARKGRQGALDAILASYQTELARRTGAVTADVISATPLSDTQRQSLIAAVTKTLGKNAKVTLNVTVDPSLLGGLKLRVGSRLYDRSLASQLNRLQHTLEQAA